MSLVRLRLCLMMFLQYAIWGSWAVSMGGYMGGVLNFTGAEIGAIYGTTAIAAMISPIYMGYLADRLFATEKMIAILHLIGALLLASAAATPDYLGPAIRSALGGAEWMTNFQVLRAIMVAYALCYMPTLALTNSISFANIGNPEKEFPGIRVWGTWGWIIAGWVVGFLLGKPTVLAEAAPAWQQTFVNGLNAINISERLPEFMAHGNAPIYLAAKLSVILGIFSFLLPHTPPKGRELVPSKPDGTDRLGILQLLTDPSFLIFVICSFFVCIPLSFYYGFANVFLTEIDAPAPTALQTIGQMSEVGFMAAMPFFIGRLGVKNMLAVGMLAWVLRYVCFGSLSFPLVVFGLILHGVCYDFFFVASQIYVDNRVSKNQQASAQSFIAFVTMGVGMYFGAMIGGWTYDSYPPKITVTATLESGADQSTETKPLPLPSWDASGKTGLAEKLGVKETDHISAEMLPDEFVQTDEKSKNRTIMKKADLAAAVEAADSNKDGKVSRVEWRKAQEHVWFYIWLWPAVGAFVTCLLFLVGFRNQVKTEPKPS